MEWNGIPTDFDTDFTCALMFKEKHGILLKQQRNAMQTDASAPLCKHRIQCDINIIVQNGTVIYAQADGRWLTDCCTVGNVRDMTRTGDCSAELALES